LWGKGKKGRQPKTQREPQKSEVSTGGVLGLLVTTKKTKTVKETPCLTDLTPGNPRWIKKRWIKKLPEEKEKEKTAVDYWTDW
jgi:hypothetical protein